MKSNSTSGERVSAQRGPAGLDVNPSYPKHTVNNEDQPSHNISFYYHYYANSIRDSAMI